MKPKKKPSMENAVRYLKNARENLQKSAIEYGHYQDRKYVKEAAAMAYLAALEAIDAFLVEKKSYDIAKLPKSIDGYWNVIDKIPHNGKLMGALNTVYQNLHCSAYYRGGTDVAMVKSGFEKAKLVIDLLSK